MGYSTQLDHGTPIPLYDAAALITPHIRPGVSTAELDRLYEEFMRAGDIVNIDVTPKFQGWHGDTSRTYEVGAVSILAARVVRTAGDDCGN